MILFGWGPEGKKVFERNRIGFTATPQYFVTDTFPRYISLPGKSYKNLQEKGTRLSCSYLDPLKLILLRKTDQ